MRRKQDQSTPEALAEELKSNEDVVTRQKLFRKLKGSLRLLSYEACYHALILFHTLRAPDTPGWCKSVVLGALAYFISLIDGIPDLTPILGYTDDVALMAATIATLATHITPEIREKAEQDLDKLFQERHK